MDPYFIVTDFIVISSLKLPFYKILLENPGKSVTSYLLMNINELMPLL